LIEAKTFRRLGPRAARSGRILTEGDAGIGRPHPSRCYEKFLTSEKLLDAKSRKKIEDKIDALLAKEREFAEKFADAIGGACGGSVYCTGDDCHKIREKWERPIAEVTPPKSSVAAV